MTTNTSWSPSQSRSKAVPPAITYAPTSHFTQTPANQTQSMPSTPSQRPQSPDDARSSPSTLRPTREGSPRSVNSESSQTQSLLRRPVRGCKYETGMARARRRVPYALGPEKLDPEPEKAAQKPGEEEMEKLNTDMSALYADLLPSPESEERRQKFVLKLEKLLLERWPGQSITVSVFGSTGNRLGTSDSDVDICITTDCRELEHVCSIAELLAKNGMERVVCVSSAKVPIVKVWDPEFQVACDMNVNNPIALENTELIRTYISIDHRFRPLAMIVKHWAKRRMLNDAALGGTLSSYTWICLVLNFLQTRNPPILPALQQEPGIQPVLLNNVNVAFGKDPDKYRDFGAKNVSTLAELLFQFFRYYAHELDFEEKVMSVRLGEVIPKTQKAWNLLQDNRLCVEEPFNVSRNLANTADDTSMRGIHQELRRAFDHISSGKLNECCDSYVQSDTEIPIRHPETFVAPQTRAIIPQAPPTAQPHQQKSHRNKQFSNGRNSSRTNGGGRRASNPPGRASTHLYNLPFEMTPQELQLQAQHQQHLLHDQLFQQYQYLQMQERELRMQLYRQSLRQGGMLADAPGGQGGQNGQPGPPSSSYPASESNVEDGMDSSLTARAAAGARAPLTAPLFQHQFGSHAFMAASMSSSGVTTNPGSPALSNAVPMDYRSARRTSASANTLGYHRAQSQPARSVTMNAATLAQLRPGTDISLRRAEGFAARRSSVASNPPEAAAGFLPRYMPMAGKLYDVGRPTAQYVGYYVSPSLVPHTRSTAISPISSSAGLAIHSGGLSPRLSARNSVFPSTTTSPSLQNLSLASTAPIGESILDGANESEANGPSRASPRARGGPLVVDGSVNSPKRQRSSTQEGASPFNHLRSSTSTMEHAVPIVPPIPEQYVTNQMRDWSRPSQNIVPSPRQQAWSSKIEPNGMYENKPARAFSTQDIPALPNMPGEGNDSASQMSAALASTGSVTRRLTQTHELGHFEPTQSTRHERDLLKLQAVPDGTQPFSSESPLLPAAAGQNGWQTQTKRKKKNKKSAKTTVETSSTNQNGGEIPPEDETLRKGG